MLVSIKFEKSAKNVVCKRNKGSIINALFHVKLRSKLSENSENFMNFINKYILWYGESYNDFDSFLINTVQGSCTDAKEKKCINSDNFNKCE